SGPWRHGSRASTPTTTFDQENSLRQLDNDALVAPTPRQKSPPAPNPIPTPEYVRQTGTASSEPPEKRAVPLPTATPTLTTISGPLRNTNEEQPRPCRISRGTLLQCLPTANLPAAPTTVNNQQIPTE
ncbi:hypothetical protein C0989_011069, partial [Termitomyces sp. Mn162]